MSSRYAAPMRARSSGRPLLETLRSLSMKLGQAPVLIITDERAVLTISEFRDELAGLFRIRLPKHETVMMLHDKGAFTNSQQSIHSEMATLAQLGQAFV